MAIETTQPNLDPAIVSELKPRSVVLGVVDLGTDRVEQAGEVAARIRGALAHLDPGQLAVAPDCGMRFLGRDVARAKLAAMVAGTQIVRSELPTS